MGGGAQTPYSVHEAREKALDSDGPQEGQGTREQDS